MKLGDGWFFYYTTDLIRHACDNHDGCKGWAGRLKGFPYRCEHCSAIMPERYEFPVRIAQADYDQKRTARDEMFARIQEDILTKKAKVLKQLMLSSDGLGPK